VGRLTIACHMKKVLKAVSDRQAKSHQILRT
jgi:hypothetical protein